MEATSEQLLWMYEKMIEIREYEETMARVYLEAKLPPKIQKGLAFDIGAGPVPGEMHLAAGQEPVAVGVCAHLRRDGVGPAFPGFVVPFGGHDEGQHRHDQHQGGDRGGQARRAVELGVLFVGRGVVGLGIVHGGLPHRLDIVVLGEEHPSQASA